MKCRSTVSAANLFCQASTVSPVWRLFVQLSQLPISPAELLSVSPVWRLFVQHYQLPISPAELLSVSPVWRLFAQLPISPAELLSLFPSLCSAHLALSLSRCYPRIYGKMFHFSRSIRSNTIYEAKAFYSLVWGSLRLAPMIHPLPLPRSV